MDQYQKTQLKALEVLKTRMYDRQAQPGYDHAALYRLVDDLSDDSRATLKGIFEDVEKGKTNE